MTSSTSKFWNPRILILALVVGLTTFAVAMGVQILFPGWSHTKQGGVVGGWMIFCFCLAPLLYRRGRGDAGELAKHDRIR